MHKGFTLVEVLVSIGVIALLIGILVPALAKSMDKSKELGSSVKLRTLGQVFEMYAQRSGRVVSRAGTRQDVSLHRQRNRGHHGTLAGR